jgi:Na+/melibiose symporter-like transporter
MYLLLGLLLLSITLGMRAAFNNYMNLYYWELASDQIRWFILGSIGGYISGFLLTTKIHKRFDKRASIVIATLGYGIFEALPVCLRMLGVFPENGSDELFPSILVFHAIGSASLSVLNISVMSALADIADENAVKFGVRQEGILYAARAFFSKADRAIGTLIAGIVLDLISFPAKAIPGQVDANVIMWLGIMDSPATVIPALFAALLYAGYSINHDKHEKFGLAK